MPFMNKPLLQKEYERIRLRNKFRKEQTKRNTKLNLQLKKYCVLLFRRCKREYYHSIHYRQNILEICKTILARNTAQINFFFQMQSQF